MGKDGGAPHVVVPVDRIDPVEEGDARPEGPGGIGHLPTIDAQREASFDSGLPPTRRVPQMSRAKAALEKIGGEAFAIVVGSLAGAVIGAAVAFALFAAAEFLAETIFGFQGFGDGPFIDMAPRSRFRGGFLVLGAIAGIPASWWWMRRMEKADEKADPEV